MYNFNFLENFAQFRCLELNVCDKFFSWRKYRYFGITGTISAGNTGTNFRRYRATLIQITLKRRRIVGGRDITIHLSIISKLKYKICNILI